MSARSHLRRSEKEFRSTNHRRSPPPQKENDSTFSWLFLGPILFFIGIVFWFVVIGAAVTVAAWLSNFHVH